MEIAESEYEKLMNDIKTSHAKVRLQQAKFDKGLSKTHGGAVALQEERIYLASLRSKLPKPRVI